MLIVFSIVLSMIIIYFSFCVETNPFSFKGKIKIFFISKFKYLLNRNLF